MVYVCKADGDGDGKTQGFEDSNSKAPKNQHEGASAFEEEGTRQQQAYPLTQSTALYKDKGRKDERRKSSR